MYLKMECSVLFFLICFAVRTIFSEVITTSPRGSPSLDTQNQSCTTSDNVPGVCVSVFQCKKYFDIYKRVWGPTASEKDKQLLKSAHCGSRPLDQRVCCEKAAVSKTLEENTNRRCGESPLKNAMKVVSGKKSILGAFPWMAALYHVNSSSGETLFSCGGSLIASDWVLTAAHCILLSPDVMVHVRLGDLDIDENVDDGAIPIEVKVKNIIRHPNYTEKPWFNDIALLHLEEPVIFFDYISPVCLHKGIEYANNESIYDPKRPTIAGWGNTDYSERTTTHLLEVSLNTVPSEKCKTIYDELIRKGEVKLDKSVLCCETPGKGECQGDSGGPLMFIGTGPTWSQGAIISYGYGCDHKEGYPSIYTKVASFIDWIEKETGLTF